MARMESDGHVLVLGFARRYAYTLVLEMLLD